LCLARIRSYDRQGPLLHGVMVINPKALENSTRARCGTEHKGVSLHASRNSRVLKDNYNTADMPTTSGSVLLEGSITPADAFIVKKLGEAGAIILATANVSEFASSGPAQLARWAVVEPQ
jgi:amidase